MDVIMMNSKDSVSVTMIKLIGSRDRYYCKVYSRTRPCDCDRDQDSSQLAAVTVVTGKSSRVGLETRCSYD